MKTEFFDECLEDLILLGEETPEVLRSEVVSAKQQLVHARNAAGP